MEQKLEVDQAMLVFDLHHLGVERGVELMVHSSLSSIGNVNGGATTVMEALLETVDRTTGTVLVPTLTGTPKDGPNHPPFFHVQESVCWTGIIPETFRRRNDAVRSLHPTHSVAAIGFAAVNLTTGHEDCTIPCGYGSPYYRLSRRGGKILLLGTTLESNTMFHTVEELKGVAYHLQKRPVSCAMVDEKGATIVREMILHDWGTKRKFSALQEDFLTEGIMKRGRIGQSESFLIDAKSMIEYTLHRLEQDPFLLIATPSIG